MDLRLEAKIASADSGIDLSVNKIRCDLGLPPNMTGPVDGCLGNRTQEFDENGILARLAGDPALNALEMELGICRTGHQLQTFVIGCEGNNQESSQQTIGNNLDTSDISQDMEIDLSSRMTRGEADYAAMDLSVHMNHSDTRVGMYEQSEMIIASSIANSLNCGNIMHETSESIQNNVDNLMGLKQGVKEEPTLVKHMEGYVGSERTADLTNVGQTVLLSQPRETIVMSGVKNCTSQENDQVSRPPVERTQHHHSTRSQSATMSTLPKGDGAGKGETRGREDSKPGSNDTEGTDAFMNVADFLELETKVTTEISVDTHATEVTFTCTACDLSFSSTNYLTQHVKHCRKLKANCLKPAAPASAAVLAENGPKATQDEGLRRPDLVSNCTYKSSPHVKKKRPGFVLATCNICGKDLRNNRSLKQHMFLHRLEAGERPFACAECPASFTQNCDLTKHKRQHTGEKPYACDACDARFTLVSNLSKHKKKHTGEKPHACSECGATFAESGSLTRHARQHSGERPYACADCGATFGQSSSLTRHRRKHTGERPYACTVCDARFTESGNLNSHRRLHTGEKPYACPRCGQGHARLSYLKNHVRTCRTGLGS